MSDRTVILPIAHQPPLPADRLILREPAGGDAVPMDVLIVGGGPGGLAAAIRLATLARDRGLKGPSGDALAIGVLEKAGSVGGHCLSGAVVNPVAFAELFPDVPEAELPLRGRVDRDRVLFLTETGSLRLPTPPTMRNHGHRVASVCEIVRWMATRAEALGVTIMPGYPAASLLVEGDRVAGVRTTASGLKRDGTPGPAFAPPTDLTARVIVLAEGTRGPLSQAYRDWRGIRSQNPQIFALGVKELWQTSSRLDAVVHTMGWPLPLDTFGGSWMYPMGDGLISVGLVAGLDSRSATLDVHEQLQRLKLHPVFRRELEGGELVEWGAKTIPEGGYYSVPDRLGGDGLLMVGDCAGFVEVSSLKGIHYAMLSGMYAADAIAGSWAAGAGGAADDYLSRVSGSLIRRDLFERRGMRLGFKHGFAAGVARAGLLTLTRGAFPGGRVAVEHDAEVPRALAEANGRPAFTPDGRYTFSKVDAVFRADNGTRDDVPAHLLVGRDVPRDVAEFYRRLCPAGVYELEGDTLVVNAPNCVDCKATDVVGPRWTPREGGSGPNYKRM